MSRVRVAFFGKSREPLSLFGLRTLLAADLAGPVTVTAAKQGTPPDGPLLDLARSHDLPVVPFAELVEVPDLVLSFSNSIIFPGEFIDRVPCGVVNLHPAPLPEYRWSHGIEHCLLNGDDTFGATLHYCDAGIDTGPVIEVRRFPVCHNDNATDVWRKVDQAAEGLLTDHLPALLSAAARGERVPAAVQPAEDARSYHATSLPATMPLDLDVDAATLERQVRAWDHPRRPPAFVRAGSHELALGWRQGQLVVLDVTRVES
jgi:methionyl-tRNA formyltransferase